MNTLRLVVSTLAVAVTIFLLQFLWYGVISTDALVVEGISRNPPDMMWLVISTLILALLFTYIYPKGVGNGSAISEGSKYGLIIGLLIFIPMHLTNYAVFDMISLGDWMVDAVVNIVILMIAGIILAYVSGLPGHGMRGPGKVPKPGGGDD